MTPRARVLLVGGVLPVAVAVIAAAVMIGWLPELPVTVAVHWNADGADGFASPWLMILLPVGLVVLYCAFSVGTAWTDITLTQKVVLVAGVWLSCLLSIGVAGALWMQRGLSDPRDAGDIALWLLLGAGVGLALAAIGWFLLPPARSTVDDGQEAHPLEIGGSERVYWSRAVHMSGQLWAVVALLFAVVATTVVVTAITAPSSLWLTGGVLVLVLVLVLTTSYWRVTIDSGGMRVRSALGWPRVTIPVDEIAAVRVIQVTPTADFGGWGWRWAAGGRTGVIMRAGEAIEVTRTSGRRFAITVDDATTGAAALSAITGARIE